LYTPSPTATYTLSLHDALPIWELPPPRLVREPVDRVRRDHRADRVGRDPVRDHHRLRGPVAGAAGANRGGADRRGLLVRRLPRRSEVHTSELQSLAYLVCRLLL